MDITLVINTVNIYNLFSMHISNYNTIGRLRKTLFLVLVFAFLTAQWSTAHIHLAEQHDHDGSYHLHDVATHAHQLINLHETIDLSQLFNDDNGNVDIVELSCECNTKNANKFGEQSSASVAAIISQNINFKSESVFSSNFKTTYHRYLDNATVQLRAPPKVS